MIMVFSRRSLSDSSISFAYFFIKFNYNLKFIFSVRLFQILFSELIKMSSEDKKKQTYFDKTWLDLGVCS